MSAVVSISFCASHGKGRDPWEAPRLPGQLHWEWLERAVDFYRAQGYPVMVAATDFHGMINVNVSPDDLSRDVAWRVFKKAHLVGCPQNPNHQVGAALCIRQGLEAASKLGYDTLIHTAEDVVPGEGVVEHMEWVLRSQGDPCDYFGSAWGPARDQLNAQFFACRVQALVGPWDAAAVTGSGCIERYLARLLNFPQRREHLWLVEDYYRHTHDPDLWRQWAGEARRGEDETV